MPYNPGVTPIGGQLIAQGINQAADSMAAGMKLYRENQLRNAALQKQNEQLAGAFLQNKDLAQYAPGGAEEIQKFLDKSIKGGGLTLKDNLALNASLNSAFLTAQHVSDLSKAKLEQERARQEIDVTNKAAERTKLDDAAAAAAFSQFSQADGSSPARFDMNRWMAGYSKNGGSAAGLAKFAPAIIGIGNNQAQEDKIAAMQEIARARQEAAEAKAQALADKTPAGYRIKPGTGGTEWETIPGSEAAMKAQEKQKEAADAAVKDAATKDQVLSGIDITVENIDKAIKAIQANPNGTTGLTGNIAKMVPGTRAYSLDAALAGVKSNIAIETLAQMRAASKTGASGFGQLSEKELNVIQDRLGAIRQGLGWQELVPVLKDIKAKFQDQRSKIGASPALPAGWKQL